MFPARTLRLLGRRGIYISLTVFILLAFSLGRLVRSSQYPLPLNFLSLSKYSYYSKEGGAIIPGRQGLISPRLRAPTAAI